MVDLRGIFEDVPFDWDGAERLISMPRAGRRRTIRRQPLVAPTGDR